MVQLFTRISLKKVARPAPPPETVRASSSLASLEQVEADFFTHFRA